MGTKKKIAIVVFIIITLIASVCFAAKDDTKDTKKSDKTEIVAEKEAEEGLLTEEMLIDSTGELSGEAEMESIVTSDDELKFVKENVFHADSNAPYTLTDNVSGNVFLAGSEITIDSAYISGDVFAAASTSITIGENTVIDGNVYLGSQNVTIKGTLYRTAYIAAKVINLGPHSSVEYDSYMTGEKVKLEGNAERSLYIYAQEVEVVDGTTIGRNLEYSSETEATVPEGAVRGEVKFNRIAVEKESMSDIALEKVKDMLGALVFTLVVFLMISLMSKKFVYRTQELLGKHPFKSIGIGLFSLIIIPILAVLLIIFGATTKVGISLIPLFITMILIANSITAIAIAGLLCARRDGMKLPIIVPIIAIMLWALEALPYIGIFVEFISLLLGIGIFMQAIFSGNKPISKGEKKEEVKEEPKKEEIEEAKEEVEPEEKAEEVKEEPEEKTEE